MLDRLRLQLLSELRIPSPSGRGVCQIVMLNLLVKLSVNIGGLKTKLIGLWIVLLLRMLAGFALSTVRAILLFYDVLD
jgi:hypothetical protein